MYIQEECVACLLGRVLYMSVRANWSVIMFSSSIPLLICLVAISITESCILKSATIIVLLSISLFSSINFCFMYFVAPMLGKYTFIIFNLSGKLAFLLPYNVLFCLLWFLLSLSLFWLIYVWPLLFSSVFYENDFYPFLSFCF